MPARKPPRNLKFKFVHKELTRKPKKLEVPPLAQIVSQACSHIRTIHRTKDLRHFLGVCVLLRLAWPGASTTPLKKRMDIDMWVVVKIMVLFWAP